MSTPKKEVLIVGLGAVGAIYALVLKNSGMARVTVVARSNYTLVQERGIDIRSRKFGEFLGWRPDRLCHSVAEAATANARYYDFVFVVTKCIPEAMPTSSLLAPFLLPSYTESFEQPTYVLLQNGLEIEVDLYSAIKTATATSARPEAPRIISVAVFILANQKGPELVEHDDNEKFVCGVYRPDDYTTVTNSPAEADLLRGLEVMLKAGGSLVQVVPEIQRRKYHKNMYNVVFASVSLLTRHPLTAIFRPPPSGDGESSYSPYAFPATRGLMEAHTVPLMEGMFDELMTLARALGFPDSEEGISSTATADAMHFIRETHATPWSFHKPSTLLDCEKGAPMEVEVIWGSVVRLAKERDIALPRVEMAYGLLVVMQNQIMRQRSLTLSA